MFHTCLNLRGTALARLHGGFDACCTSRRGHSSVHFLGSLVFYLTVSLVHERLVISTPNLSVECKTVTQSVTLGSARMTLRPLTPLTLLPLTVTMRPSMAKHGRKCMTCAVQGRMAVCGQESGRVQWEHAMTHLHPVRENRKGFTSSLGPVLTGGRSFPGDSVVPQSVLDESVADWKLFQAKLAEYKAQVAAAEAKNNSAVSVMSRADSRGHGAMSDVSSGAMSPCLSHPS